jgi:hypothetical protein
MVAVVADGCSAGASSEVGARLGAAWLSRAIPGHLFRARSDEEGLESLAAGLVGYLARAARGLATSAEARAEVIAEHFLFTFLAAVVDQQRYLVFGVGDGLFQIVPRSGGAAPARVQIPAGPGNAPDYLAYRLVPPELLAEEGPRTVAPRIHARGRAEDLAAIVIATDGAAELDDAELAAFAGSPSDLRNPFLAQRRLQALAATRRLADDTTLALVLRTEDDGELAPRPREEAR